MGDKNSFHDHFSWPYDSLLGLQADIQFTPSLSATAQLVLKERVENNLDETLEWAFVRWRPNDLVSIRGGRMGADFYMLADYRNVSYTYLWQRPPSEFYTPVLVENFDGLDITLSTKAGRGLLQCKLFGGSSVKPILFSSDADPTDLDFKPFYGGRISYELDTWQLSGGFATTTIDSDVSYLRPVVTLLSSPLMQQAWPDAPAIANELQPEGEELSFYSIGAGYDNNNWVLQAEVGYLDSSWLGVGSIASAYLSIGKRIDLYTPYVLLAAAKSDDIQTTFTPPAVGSGAEAIYNQLPPFLNGHNVDQQSISLGLRRDIGINTALKFQWNHTHIAADGAGMWHDAPKDAAISSQDVDVLSLTLNWMF